MCKYLAHISWCVFCLVQLEALYYAINVYETYHNSLQSMLEAKYKIYLSQASDSRCSKERLYVHERCFSYISLLFFRNSNVVV